MFMGFIFILLDILLINFRLNGRQDKRNLGLLLMIKNPKMEQFPKPNSRGSGKDGGMQIQPPIICWKDSPAQISHDSNAFALHAND